MIPPRSHHPRSNYKSMQIPIHGKGFFFDGRYKLAKARKRGHFAVTSYKNLQISACDFRNRVSQSVSTLPLLWHKCIKKLKHTLDALKIVMYMENNSSLINYSHRHKNGNLSYATKHVSRFALKGCVLFDLKIGDFVWKEGVFFVQNPQKGCVFQTTWVQV